MYLLVGIGLYLVVGNLLHRVILPEEKPDVSAYFKPGQEFYSKAEGFRQTITKHENGLVYGHLDADPYAPGPPKHVHDNFDETFEIENGELTVWVDGEIKKLHPGEKLHIPKGTPHKPYNETGEVIHVKGSFAFPEKFAFNLSQIYGYMDDHPDFEKSPRTIFQIALFQEAGFDSYLVDGPPVAIQKLTGWVANPLSRLFGLRSYYEAYRLDNKQERTTNVSGTNGDGKNL